MPKSVCFWQIIHVFENSTGSTEESIRLLTYSPLRWVKANLPTSTPKSSVMLLFPWKRQRNKHNRQDTVS